MNRIVPRYFMLGCAIALGGCEIIGATTGHVSYDIDVVDAVTRQPIPAAHVFVKHEAVDDLTDAAGHYAFGTKADLINQSWFIGDWTTRTDCSLGNGRVLIRVDKPGYLPAEIEAGYNRTTRVANDWHDAPVDPQIYRQIALRQVSSTRPAAESP